MPPPPNPSKPNRKVSVPHPTILMKSSLHLFGSDGVMFLFVNPSMARYVIPSLAKPEAQSHSLVSDVTSTPPEAGMLEIRESGGAWLALSEEHTTLGLRVVSSSRTLGVEVKGRKRETGKEGRLVGWSESVIPLVGNLRVPRMSESWTAKA